MKSMLEEYGKIVVVSIVIAIMIGAAALLRGQIELPFQKITKLGSDEVYVATTDVQTTNNSRSVCLDLY